jgi:hypothetical protein
LEILHGTHDGLEREFKFFNWLEGGVCTMCAPGDQRKSSYNQGEQTELNGLRFHRVADISEDVIALGKPSAAKPARAQTAE